MKRRTRRKGKKERRRREERKGEGRKRKEEQTDSGKMGESITVEVMLNEDNADDDDGGNGGFTSSEGRMFGGMGMAPVQSVSTASANNQSGVVFRMPQEVDEAEPEQGGARRKTTSAATASTTAAAATTSTKSDAAAKRLFRRGDASSDSEDVSDVSSDVSSRLSPLTPSPDCLLDEFRSDVVLTPATGKEAKAAAGAAAGATAGAETAGQQNSIKGKADKKGFITVTATDLSASSHAIDSMTDAHLQQQRQEAEAATAATTSTATSDDRISIEEEDSSSSTPPKESLLRRVKQFLAPEGPPGKAYVMTEEEMAHMTVNNILYFTGAVVLFVLIYVMYADTF